MALLDFLFPSRRRAEMDALVDQIAGACVEAVCRRVELQAAGMTPSEARGYIRARSTPVVHQKTVFALAHRSRQLAAQREHLQDLAREEVTRRVLTRVRQPRQLAAQYRRAA
jgi:hypothetical protein